MSNLVPFRNRLAHHETIIGRPILRHHEEMLQLAGLVDRAARDWIDSISRVDVVLEGRPSVW